uniref:UORF 4 n=1 Tax=Zea mays TaxID=4577 RepID=Q94IJ0_MAIZE|nr:uORF 4 [Zea mays]
MHELELYSSNLLR